MTTVAEHLHAIGIGELDRMMVKNLAVLFADANLPSARATGFDRRPLHDPIADVQVMDMLFDDMIAAEPREVVPVADLMLHLRFARFTRLDPDASGVEVGTQELNFTDRAVMDSVDHFAVLDFVSQMMPNGDQQLFLFGLFRSLP